MPTERSAEEIVKAKCPGAYLRRTPTGTRVQQNIFISEGNWLKTEGLSKRMRTSKEAWADAAARIKASERVPVPSSDAPADQRSAHAPQSTSEESQ